MLGSFYMQIFDLKSGLETDPKSLANRIGEALQGERCFVVTRHGLDAGLLAKKRELDHQLFALPNIEAYIATGGINDSGYFKEGKEYATSVRKPEKKRMWQMYRELPKNHPLYESYTKNRWPKELPEFREVCVELQNQFDQLGNSILGLLEMYLQVESGFFTRMATDGRCLLRTNYYPPLKDLAQEEYGEDRINAHTDVNFITLMPAPEEGGFQVKDAQGVWQAIEAPLGSVIVITGKMMMFVTNAFIKPGWHRVVDPADSSKERFSLPFFVHPKPSDLLTPIARFVGPYFPPPLPPMTRNAFVEATRTDTSSVRQWIMDYS